MATYSKLECQPEKVRDAYAEYLGTPTLGDGFPHMSFETWAFEQAANETPIGLAITTPKIIKLNIPEPWSDYMNECYLPLQDNLDKEGVDTFDELKEKWEAAKWGFTVDVVVQLVDMPEEYRDIDQTKMSRCSEFDIWGFDELMVDSDLYDRPFDNSPAGYMFICQFAEDCMKGDVYSKDFAFFECTECERSICQQNPSNGWHSQAHSLDGDEWGDGCGFICNKCYEEKAFREGVSIDEMLRKEQIPGQFFNDRDLEAHGFYPDDEFNSVEIAAGRVGYTDPDKFFSRIKDRAEELKQKIVVINYESMSIGGLGGYVSVWLKDKVN